jgi:hypothetical protein
MKESARMRASFAVGNSSEKNSGLPEMQEMFLHWIVAFHTLSV